MKLAEHLKEHEALGLEQEIIALIERYGQGGGAGGGSSSSSTPSTGGGASVIYGTTTAEQPNASDYAAQTFLWLRSEGVLKIWDFINDMPTWRVAGGGGSAGGNKYGSAKYGSGKYA